VTDQDSDSNKPQLTGFALPAGVELTPEAQRLLGRQLSFQIVAGYWVSKILYAFFGCLFLAASGFMVFIAFKVGVDSLWAILVAFCVIGIPAACALGLFRLAIRY